MEIVREYKTLKLFRCKRKDDKLFELATKQKDFEFRNLLIEEFEEDLHVAISRKVFFTILAIIFIIISIVTISNLQISKIFLILSIINYILNLFYGNKIKKLLSKFYFSISLVDDVIENTYGISLPKYL